MAHAQDTPSTMVQLARWTGRAIGSLFVAFWLFIGVVGGISESGDPWTWETTGIVLLFIASATSVSIAWLWERIGSALVLACAVAYGVFAYFSAGHNRGMAMVVAGGPLVLSGLLLLGSWWGTRREGSST